MSTTANLRDGTLRRNDVLVYAPKPQRRRVSFVGYLPVEVLLLDELAIAVYENDAVVQYGSLHELLTDHDLRMDELVLQRDQRVLATN